MKRLAFFLVAGLVAATSLADETKPSEFDWGFLASRYTDANGDLRFRALGPLFESSRSATDQRLWALRPLYASAADDKAGVAYHDFLWPIGMSSRIRDDLSCRFLLAYYWNHEMESPDPRWRFWLLPIYFQGQDQAGQGYWGLFPIGGSIHEFFGRDEINFVLFPAYVGSNVGPVQTHTYLWPIISRTEGKGIYRFRVVPFYGQSKHRDHFRKRFIMWPIWTTAEFYYPGSSGSGYILFPLWGHIDLEDQESWMFLPPIFRFTRGQRLNLTYCPWPFFQRSTGEVEKLYIWPLWGRKLSPGNDRAFFLWPLFHSELIDRGDYLLARRRFVPFVNWATERSDQAPKGEAVSTYFKLWPLFSWQRRGDRFLFRCLELWPASKNPGPIDRSFAPLWTLWSKTGVGENRDTELLWGLYRHRTRGEDFRAVSLFPLVSWERDGGEDAVREWSFLKGLVGYRREGTNRSLRLLYFLHFGGTGKP